MYLRKHVAEPDTISMFNNVQGNEQVIEMNLVDDASIGSNDLLENKKNLNIDKTGVDTNDINSSDLDEFVNLNESNSPTPSYIESYRYKSNKKVSNQNQWGLVNEWNMQLRSKSQSLK